MLLRRLSTTAILSASVAVTQQTRSFVACKGVVENRIQKQYYNKSASEVRAEMQVKAEKHKHPNPKNKKEELAHLTRQCDFEYTPDFQRAANDMMAVYSDPVGYSHDMAYHYSRIWKAMNPSKRNVEDGNDSFEIVKLNPK